jgi:3-oxoacyl-[acyl-carrier-protein] synthase-3
MGFESKAIITALGAYVPPKTLTNFDLEKMVDTSDEWIIQRTGIRVRHIADDGVYASDLAIKAAQDLAGQPGMELADVDLIIVTTMSPDYLTPSTAGRVQGALGLKNAAVLDLNAACAGFVYGLCTANALVTVGQYNKVLVIATEVLSKITDYKDRNTCVLFGDAAGAVLVERSEGEGGFIEAHSGSNGELGHKLYCPGLADSIEGGNKVDKKVIWQDGKGVYIWAIHTIPQGMNRLLEKAGMTAGDLDWFVPHSANMRMIKSIAKRWDIPMSKTLTSVEEYGNTSSVTIPLALWLAVRNGKLKKGDILALYGFGGGLTHAGVILRW